MPTSMNCIVRWCSIGLIFATLSVPMVLLALGSSAYAQPIQGVDGPASPASDESWPGTEARDASPVMAPSATARESVEEPLPMILRSRPAQGPGSALAIDRERRERRIRRLIRQERVFFGVGLVPRIVAPFLFLAWLHDCNSSASTSHLCGNDRFEMGATVAVLGLGSSMRLIGAITGFRLAHDRARLQLAPGRGYVVASLALPFMLLVHASQHPRRWIRWRDPGR